MRPLHQSVTIHHVLLRLRVPKDASFAAPTRSASAWPSARKHPRSSGWSFANCSPCSPQVFLIGVPVALGIARGLTSFLKSELFQVSAMDPIAFITACVVVSAMTLIAAWIPARRAANVDPLIALRCE
jgi:hypothetical protein